MKSNGRVPSARDLHGLGFRAPDPSTTILQTTTKSYLQRFDDWWIKFAYWTCDLTTFLNPRALIQVLQRSDGDRKKLFFGHTTAFPWPTWPNYAPRLLNYARLFLLSPFIALYSMTKNIFNAVKQYFVSWSFVDRLVWGVIGAGITYWLLDRLDTSSSVQSISERSLSRYA
jgi:hypothetical protein